MQAFSVEESIMEGENEVKELFEFVKDKAREFDAYEIEKSIFSRVMKKGLSAMKCYFAEKGTGEKGPQLELKEDRIVLKLESILRGRDYFSKGYPIGSGVVESSCGHTVKDRMEGTGRRWSVEGAESLLLLRSIYTSGDWDSYMKIEENVSTVWF